MMASFPPLPSCLQFHVSFLPLVSSNPGLPTEVLFTYHPSHTALEEQMRVARAREDGSLHLSNPSSQYVAMKT